MKSGPGIFFGYTAILENTNYRDNTETGRFKINADTVRRFFRINYK